MKKTIFKIQNRDIFKTQLLDCQTFKILNTICQKYLAFCTTYIDLLVAEWVHKTWVSGSILQYCGEMG